MENSEIISNTENIEAVVTSFASQIENYVEKMQENVNRLRAAVAGLESGWGADDFSTFQSTMEEKNQLIESELARAKELKQYLDEAALEMREWLAELKRAGGDE